MRCTSVRICNKNRNSVQQLKWQIQIIITTDEECFEIYRKFFLIIHLKWLKVSFLADITSWSMSYTNVGKVRTKLCEPYTYLGFILQFDCPCGFSGAETWSVISGLLTANRHSTPAYRVTVETLWSTLNPNPTTIQNYLIPNLINGFI